MVAVQARLAACVELLGERDERMEELKADLSDVKEVYKEQISFMAEKLTENLTDGSERVESIGVAAPGGPIFD